MRIYFQNPTQGPLITVSFEDNDGPLLAFVPAAVDCGAKAAVATGGVSLGGPLALAAIVSGDSSPQPLRGLSRFSSQASTVISGATPDPVDAAADLPEDPSPTTAAAPIDWAALAVSDPIAFCKLAHRYIDSVKAETLRRVARGDTAQDIDRWFQSEAKPTLESLLDILRENKKSFRTLVQVFDVFTQRVLILRNGFENALEDGDLAALGKVCRMDPQVLDNFIIRLRLMFMDTVDIHIAVKGSNYEIDPSQVESLFQRLADIVGDVAKHAKSDERPGVVIQLEGARLIVRPSQASDERIWLDFPAAQ